MRFPLLRQGLLFALFIVSASFVAQANAEDRVFAVLLGKEIKESAVSPEPAQLNGFARTLGVSKEMALAQFQHAKLTEIIVEGVLQDYAKQHHISADPELVARFLEVFGESLNTPEEAPPQNKEDADAPPVVMPAKRAPDVIAKEQVERWELDKALYEAFGGAVIFRSNTPQYPVAAYNQLLRQYATTGKLVIKEESFAGLFWRSFAPPYNAVIDPANVDFSHPWWY